MHVRMRSVSPLRARAGTSASAISARVIPTRSHAPSASARSAISGRLIRPSAITARPGAALLGASCERHAVSGLELHRRHDQERRLVVAVTDTDVVDLAVLREVRDSLLVPLHGRADGDPEQPLGADLGAQRAQDLAREARALSQPAAVAVSAAIPLRREELVDERVVGEHALDAVHAGGERSPRSGEMAFDERGDVLVVHRSQPIGSPGREAGAGRPALGVSRERIGVGAEVIQLRDEHRAVLVHCVDDAAESGYEALVVVAVVLRRHSAVRQHGQRLHHDQPGATGSPRRVVVPSTLARNVILPERHGVRREHDTARQALPTQLHRRQQQRETRVHGLAAPFCESGPRIIRSRTFAA